MIFGDLALDRAEGAILAHTLRAGKLVLHKGRVLSAADVAALRAAGRESIVAVRLEPGDVHEDEAAARLARALAGTHALAGDGEGGLTAGPASTGRVNLFAAARGLAVIDRDRLDRINRLDEAVTVATLREFAPVEPGQMVATVKIIPFAAPDTVLAAAEKIAAESADAPILRVAPFRGRVVALIQTRLNGTKDGVLDKTAEVTAGRLAALGCTLAEERRCAHAVAPLAAEIAAVLAAGAELVLIAGASAITDRRDVLPEAVEAAGGAIDHLGMPVDPGNLMLLAHHPGAGKGAAPVPVLGLPGCARSPRLNGLDWVLERLAADLPVGPAEIMGMGVGGLLAEIPSRPSPRQRPAEPGHALRAEASAGPHRLGPPAAPRIAAIVLAAGESRRMRLPGSEPGTKLLCPIDGRPMLLWAVEAALASQADPVIVVTGHARDAVEAALAGRAVRLVHNPAYAEGLSTSLRAGLAAVPAGAEGALVLLGDMPRIGAALLDRLIAAYAPVEGRAIVVPTRDGKRGNPVLWDRRFFAAMDALRGDVGARHLIGEHDDWVAEVAVEDDAPLLDVDTPQALARLAGAELS